MSVHSASNEKKTVRVSIPELIRDIRCEDAEKATTAMRIMAEGVFADGTAPLLRCLSFVCVCGGDIDHRTFSYA